jgi:zinc transporter ZupT
MLATLEFCSHGFLEGLAIGLTFQIQFSLGIFVAIAVVTHDFCDGISTLTLMLNSGNTPKTSLRLLFVDAIAFLVGSFLYIGGGTLLPDAYKMNRPSTTVSLFIFGFFLVLFFTKII